MIQWPCRWENLKGLSEKTGKDGVGGWWGGVGGRKRGRQADEVMLSISFV